MRSYYDIQSDLIEDKLAKYKHLLTCSVKRVEVQKKPKRNLVYDSRVVTFEEEAYVTELLHMYDLDKFTPNLTNVRRLKPKNKLGIDVLLEVIR